MKRFNLRHQCALGALAGAMAFAPSAASAQDTTTTEQDTDLVAAADVDDGNVIRKVSNEGCDTFLFLFSFF